MGFIKTGTTVDMMVYLTAAGREALLNQGFVPTYFSLIDDDANYNANESLTQVEPDLTGDYSDNIFSLSQNVNIKNQIIYSISTTPTVRVGTAIAATNLVAVRSTAAVA